MKSKFISIFLIIVILTTDAGFAFLAPRPASASVKSTAVSFTGCFTAGVLTPIVQKKIDQGVEKLSDWVSKHVDTLVGKFLGGLIGKIPGASNIPGLGAVPVYDEAVANVQKTAFASYIDGETRRQIITRCVAWSIMSNMTNNIMTVVRTHGREGGATFVQNWTNFQTNAQYRGENIFRAELSTAKLCNYLATDVKKSFGVDPKTKTPLTGQNTRTNSLQSFGLATQCTLPADFTPEKYQQDFAGNGGWDTFVRILEPRNNIMGLTMLSLNEAQKQRALAEAADINQVLANDGYTGVSGNGKAGSCSVMGPTGQCLTFKDIKTTGNYLAQNVGASIGAQFAWLTSAQGLNTIIADATEIMLNRLLDFGSPDEGSYHMANDSGENMTLSLPTDPTPTPGTPGEPPTVPNPGAEPDSLLSDMQAERAKYNTPMTPAELGSMLNAVAWKNKDSGWVLLGKSSGTNCPAPSGALISCDFLVHQPTLSGYDVLLDAEGSATPIWDGPDPNLPGLIGSGARTLVPPTQP